jgi:prepilin-type N-terminal cleavage/methylation domain-containing protein
MTPIIHPTRPAKIGRIGLKAVGVSSTLHIQIDSFRRNYMRERRNGFTLIELLVVVSIIALLVSILLPALGRAKETAKKVACMNNLRQTALGFFYYTRDYGMYPSRNSMSLFYFDWTTELIHPSYPRYYYVMKGAKAYDSWKKDWNNQYLGNFAVLECPSDKGDAVWPELSGKKYYHGLGTSYRYNCRDNGETPDDAHKGSLMNASPDNIRNASELILLGDPEMNAQWGNYAENEKRWYWHERNKPYANIIFGDFHVQGIVMRPFPGSYQRGPGWSFIADPDRYDP